MNENSLSRKDGDLNASLNLQLASAADLSVFFLYSEGLEVATIIRGDDKNESLRP
tara:strand:+ start:348 stop:512 length:165 start_codon:yes stop_codon:yes gene_type:complete